MGVVMVPAQQPFTPALAAWLAATYAPAEALALQLWLPTQRAGRALSRSLASHGWSVLPAMRTLAIDEVTARQLGVYDGETPLVNEATLLAEAMHAWRRQRGDMPATRLVRMAADVIGLWRRLVRHGVPWRRVAQAVPESLAEHWQRYADDIVAVLQTLEQRLAALGQRDGAAAADLWLRQLARTMAGAARPVIMAGITDATPAGLEMMRAVAAAPHGWVVLPETPQGEAMAARLGDVPCIRLDDGTAPPSSAMMLVEAATVYEEAQAITRVVRQALAENATPVAVVAVNRDVARHAQAALAAEGIMVADSAKTPLAETPAGRFMLLLAKALAAPEAITMAALAAHPLVAPLDNWSTAATALEHALWRGSTPGRTWYEWQRLWQRRQRHMDAPIRAACKTAAPAWHVFDDIWSNLSASPRPLAAWLEDIRTVADRLAPAWKNAHGGPETEAWLARTAAGTTPSLTAAAMAALLDMLAAGTKVEPQEITPQVYLWGAQEMRMQVLGTLVLAGCNDDSWPPQVHDPLLSEAQLDMLGLPTNRHRAQVAAEDWQLALASARKVVFTRSRTAGGAPAVMAPLLRHTLASQDETALRQAGDTLLATLHPHGSATPPAPAAWVPHGETWPAVWSASMVEALRRCPYRALAERVLNLAPLPAFNAPAERREFGLLVHRWLQALFVDLPGLPPAVPVAARGNEAALEAHLLASASKVMAGQDEALTRLWQTRAPVLAKALAGQLARQATGGWQVAAVEDALPEATLGAITVRARADRLDRMGSTARVADYKTGGAPSEKDMKTGRKPQLPLEGWLLEQAGHPTAAAQVWQVRGYGPHPLKVAEAGEESWRQAVGAVGPGLVAMATLFAEGAGFPAWPAMDKGGVQRAGHCETCALAGVCRFREVTA